MSPLVAELIGTAILVLLGNGVVCNVVLAKTKGNSGGWIVITAGWGMAVFCAAAIAGQFSGAHLNPAITVAEVVKGGMGIGDAFGYIAAQIAGAILGATLVYWFYKPHFEAEGNADNKLACFSTAPAIPGHGQALFCEIVGTFVLMFALLNFQSPKLETIATSNPTTAEVSTEGATDATNEKSSLPQATRMQLGLGAMDFIPVALLVFAIGVSLGGTTGYAINPARDLGPRIAHHFLPIPGKRDSDWSYAWVPVAGPIVGAVLAVLAWKSL